MGKPRGNPNWKKGVSGNPGGRQAVPDEVKQAFDEMTPRAVAKLSELIDDPDADIALKAVIHVLDRRLGKPRQAIDVTDMTDEQVREELRRVLRESGLSDEAEAPAEH